MTNGQRFAASNQFTIFPEQGPAPVWIIPRVYTDSLNNMYGGQWSTTPYGGAIVNPVDASAAYQGAAGLSISNFGAFSGVIFISPCLFPKPVDGALEFAIKTTTSATATNLSLLVSGVNEFGLDTDSSLVQLPPISNSWQSIHILLDPARAPVRINHFQIMNGSSVASPPVSLDSIRFRQP